MTRVYYDPETGVPGVRLATKSDEADIFALLLMLHAENGMFSLNHDKVIAGIQWATERQGGLIFVIPAGDGRIVATMGMTVTSDWYSDDEYLLERWNYVHPEHRRSDYARKLLEQGKWASEWFRAKNRRAVPFLCGINSFDRLESKVRLYARHMPCIGAYFMYGAPPLQGEKAKEEARRVEQKNFDSRGKPSPHNIAVRPVVETIIRVSQRGDEHVQ